MLSLVERFKEFRRMAEMDVDDCMNLTEEDCLQWEKLRDEFTVGCDKCKSTGMGDWNGHYYTECGSCEGRGYQYNAELIREIFLGIGDGIRQVYYNEYMEEVEFFIVDGHNIRKVEEVFGDFNDAVEIITGESNNWGYDDEYSECHECGRLIGTQAQYWGWTPDYGIINECELLCGECIRRGASENYLEEYVNNSHKANTVLGEADFEALGYKMLDENYHNGMDWGNDDPTVILNRLSKEYECVVFDIVNIGMCHTEYCVWVKDKIGSEEDIA